jgi:hypothetical protein
MHLRTYLLSKLMYFTKTVQFSSIQNNSRCLSIMNGDGDAFIIHIGLMEVYFNHLWHRIFVAAYSTFMWVKV